MSERLRLSRAHQVVVRELVVAEVHDLSPDLRSVVLTGPDLAGVTTADGVRLDPLRSSGFDDCVLALFPHPGESEVLLPVQTGARIADRPDGRSAPRRAYTVRRWEPERARLTLEFVLHGHGPAARWAAAAEPGGRLHVYGPTRSDDRPRGAAWLLMAGDETALPAIARWLEELAEAGDGTPARVLIEVGGPADELDLVAPAGAEITWLHRGATPAHRSTLLLDALTGLARPDGDGFVWVAAETTVLRGIRAVLRDDWRLPRERMEVWGYWRFHPAGASQYDDDFSAPEETLAPEEDHDDHADDDMYGVASAILAAGLLDGVTDLHLHTPRAERVAAELTGLGVRLRPVLADPAAPAGDPGDAATILWQPPVGSAAEAERHLALGRDLAERGWRVIVLIDPEEVGEVGVPESAAGVRHDLGWVGDAFVLEPGAAR